MSMFREGEEGRRRVNVWLVAAFSVISLPYLWADSRPHRAA